MPVTPHLIELTAADGYVLGATRYVANVPSHARLVVAGATAVPQGFYKRFAEFAASRGFEVLTFDYRGIGRSRPGSLKGFRMDLLDWGRLDLAAAVDAMADPQVPLFIVGHSFGGHAFGLLPNHHKVGGFYVFGTGAGWHGYMPMGERLRVLTMWNLVLPVLTWWNGYCPWKLLGMGEDLPVDVYRQWRHWCRFPHYFFDDPAMRGIERSYAAVRTPIVAANSLDDLWAMPASRDAFVQSYRNALLTRKDLNPAHAGGTVGHMGYFRPSAAPYWDEALSWFTSLTPRLGQA
ncbi:putative alpha/beta hydrolase protein [Pseudomonas amygdali pv. hibisci]|uniref:alpha/beta hydrolase family protein n=1 Tax=Pseudomonas amygdali TaxID=47877 RepID=UPI000F003CDC|nr:alpha/beta fold hydrolase [Pseudomonas amygdali]RMN53149.1 putative alpha/beta hydrolase protein [Pseudomonas amygdali pv. hibisci]